MVPISLSMSSVFFMLLSFIVVSFLTTTITTSVSAVSNCDSSITFTGTMTLNANDGFKVSWYLDNANSELYLKLEMNAAASKGFMGFGLGEETSGSMLGADIVTVRINNGNLVVEDRYVLFDPYPIDAPYPTLDSCQDWIPVGSDILANSWSAIIKRKVSTGDSQDRDIFTTKSQRIIYAWSKTATSVQYHGSNRGFNSIDFSSSSTTTPIPSDSTTTLDINMGSYTLPTAYDTYYTCKGFDLSQMVDINGGDRHIVRVDPVVQAGNENYVHHMLLHICGTSTGSPYDTHPAGTAANICQGGNGNGASPLSIGTCKTLAYGWAVGSSSLVLPDGVGIRVGTSGSQHVARYVILEIHYDNPSKTSGIVDSSGVKLYMTDKGATRTHDSASLILGVSGTPSNFAANTANQHLEGTCSAACTNQFSGAVNVYASFLHAHAYGKQLWTSHSPSAVKANRVVRNRIDFWNFAFQQITPMSYTINKGDMLSTHGVFDLTQSSSSVSFGEKSSQEMLFDFTFVYPASNLNGIYTCGTFYYTSSSKFTLCGTSPILETTPNPDGDTSLTATFGPTSPTCTGSPTSPTQAVCFPTQSPTTGTPSTSPTTSRPTLVPTTGSPTTGTPSTTPTTGAPSKAPSTAAPTTGTPTTGSPTTASPTTGSPTTSAPSKAPSTASPTTGTPTKSPTTPTTSNPTHTPTKNPTQSPAASPTSDVKSSASLIAGFIGYFTMTIILVIVSVLI